MLQPASGKTEPSELDDQTSNNHAKRARVSITLDQRRALVEHKDWEERLDASVGRQVLGGAADEAEVDPAEQASSRILPLHEARFHAADLLTFAVVNSMTEAAQAAAELLSDELNSMVVTKVANMKQTSISSFFTSCKQRSA